LEVDILQFWGAVLAVDFLLGCLEKLALGAIIGLNLLALVQLLIQ